MRHTTDVGVAPVHVIDLRTSAVLSARFHSSSVGNTVPVVVLVAPVAKPSAGPSAVEWMGCKIAACCAGGGPGRVSPPPGRPPGRGSAVLPIAPPPFGFHRRAGAPAGDAAGFGGGV